jgi:hypothetical protein
MPVNAYGRNGNIFYYDRGICIESPILNGCRDNKSIHFYIFNNAARIASPCADSILAEVTLK